MSKTHFVFSDAHAHPDYSNERADWLGEFMFVVRPDVVIDIGDTADMASLSEYDKNKRSYQGRAYAKDIEAHNDFQERLWYRWKKSKKKLPRAIRLIGNHDQRIDRVLDHHPELVGTVGYHNLELDRYYDTIVPYNGNAPGTITIDGVTYSHFFVSGVMGKPVSGEHPAYTLLSKKHASCTQGHTHVMDYCVRTKEDGSRLMGLITGCYQDYDAPWAGQANKLWYRAAFVKDHVENGQYNLHCYNMDYLRRVYS